MDICFLDTETLGLDPRAPIWEFAAVRVFADGRVDQTEFRIRHLSGDWLPQLPPEFQQDYARRYDSGDALDELTAAVLIHIVTRGAIVVGCNPGFDLDSQRLAALLLRNGFEPEWHYHPLDTASMAQGWLSARGLLPPGPWKSDQLSALIGVDPADYPRHTAMGDARWCRAQWDVMMAAADSVPTPAVEDGKITRDVLLGICRDAFVPQEKWDNRDSASAQMQLGQAYALLSAGCDFAVRTERDTHWVRIEYRGFNWFEGGFDYDEPRDAYLEHDEFYLPTRERLNQSAGSDWY